MFQLEGVQPLASPEDCFDAEAIAKSDPEVVSLLKERYGITDLDLVACDPWSVHCAPREGRLIQLFTYLRSRCAYSTPVHAGAVQRHAIHAKDLATLAEIHSRAHLPQA
jgi:Cu2+-containing amine oxidase